VEVSLPGPPAPRKKSLGLAPRGGEKVETVFRITPAGSAYLGRGAWTAAAGPGAPTRVHIGLDGVIRVPAAITPYHRFRVARVTKWLGLEGAVYTYRLTPASLRRAAKQGVELGRIIDFLREVADEHGLPPTLLGALQRWARSGAEAALEDLTVLRLKSPELLDTLRRTPKLKDYLGRPLGPAAVEVRRDAVERLRAALAEVGILSD